MSSILLDTHSFLWWAEENKKLPVFVREKIKNIETKIFVSDVSFWEIAIKISIGKLPDYGSLIGLISESGFASLPVKLSHIDHIKSMPLHHRDPFDRMLVAQSLVEQIPIVSNEKIFDRYGVERIWDI